jgi:hypothetical protein
MSRPVPYLSEEQIERDADELLGEYAKGRRAIIAAPIPIEDIVEKHLKLGIEFDDMHRLIGVPRDRPGGDADILGAILFEDRRIVIDESLDPEEYPAREAGIGVSTGAYSPQARRRPFRSGRWALRSSAVRAKPRSAWSGKRIFMLLAF